jgi:hypothetical protein
MSHMKHLDLLLTAACVLLFALGKPAPLGGSDPPGDPPDAGPAGRSEKLNLRRFGPA